MKPQVFQHYIMHTNHQQFLFNQFIQRNFIIFMIFFFVLLFWLISFTHSKQNKQNKKERKLERKWNRSKSNTEIRSFEMIFQANSRITKSFTWHLMETMVKNNEWNDKNAICSVVARADISLLGLRFCFTCFLFCQFVKQKTVKLNWLNYTMCLFYVLLFRFSLSFSFLQFQRAIGFLVLANEENASRHKEIKDMNK